jgi:hypothetical protein
MPILAPVSNLKESRLSQDINTEEKPIPVTGESSPFRTGAPTSQFLASDNATPSKLVMTSFTPQDDSSSPSEEEEELDLTEESVIAKIVKTEHKLFEESDAFEEPLLKENPHRFVLFPIQDNDVSTVGIVGNPIN